MAKRKHTTFRGLFTDMLAITRDAIEEVSEEIKESGIVQEKIQELVYDKYDPKEYERTGEFRDSARLAYTESRGLFGSTFDFTIEHDVAEMPTHDPENFVHGSNYWVTDDVRGEVLSEIIENGDQGPMFGSGGFRTPRPYKEQIIDDLTRGGALAKRVKKKIKGAK